MLQDLKSSCMHKRLLFRDIEKVGFFDVSICYPKLYYGKGNGNPLQYSCLENPVDRGTWWAAVHGVAQSQTRLKRLSLHACMHALKKEMATHSSILAWRIPGTEEHGELPSLGSHRVGHYCCDLAAVVAANCINYRLY